MSKSYILISELSPLKYEFSNHLFESDRDNSKFVISLTEMTKPKKEKNELHLYAHYTFEISDNKSIVCGFSINHLDLDKILFDFEKNNIEFYLHFKNKMYNHKIVMFRKNIDIRIDVIMAIEYFFKILSSDDLSRITEIKTPH